MKPLIHFRQTPIFLTTLALFCCGILPVARAVVPPPDGGYPGFNTAEGTNALKTLTTGSGNTGLGWFSLFSNTTASFNTAVGAGTLLFNNEDSNTAIGTAALLFNTTGSGNTAVGTQALSSNTTASFNTGTGFRALMSNTDTGFGNTADGANALENNTTGIFNTATGAAALVVNVAGDGNTAVGNSALSSNTGDNNIALGLSAGTNLTTGDNNIDIGNEGIAGEADTIRIGVQGTQTTTFIAGISGATASGGVAVFVNTDGQLGTLTSSGRFKEQIQPMEKTSEAILALKPVTFRYRKEIDRHGIPQFGLVAEEVYKVSPDLVVRDNDGKPYSVRYEAVNAMLLNEFLKEHQTVQELKSAAVKQQAMIASLQKQIEALTAGLQKVSAQLELNNPVPRTVLNDQ